MKFDITAETLKPAAQKLVDRLNQMGVVSKSGQPLVVDHGFEVVAALFGRRNQHALRAALSNDAKCSCCSPAPTKLDDAKVEILKTLGYSVALSDFKLPYWEHGDDASEDFQTEDEAWLAAMADARERRRFADGDPVAVDPQSEMAQVIKDLEARWGNEHDWYTRADWQLDVSKGDTKLGYWEWVEHNIESHGGDEAHCDKCGEPAMDDGEGYDGMCGNCADAAEDDRMQDIAQQAYEDFDFQAELGEHITAETRDGWVHMSGEGYFECIVYLKDSRKPDAPTSIARFLVDIEDADSEAVNARVITV
jgi:hypothetical protein